MKKILLFIICIIGLTSFIHAVTVTPGKTWVTGEDITATALNATATPTVTLDASDITSSAVATNAIDIFHLSNSVFQAHYNLLINGNMDVWQRGTTIDASVPAAIKNDDDLYWIDHWIGLSDGNDIVDITRSTTAPRGSKYSAKFEVQTINKKFGIFQPLESIHSVPLTNQIVSVSCQARTEGSELAELRMAVVSWSSTEDSITSDIVSTWQASGTAPTLVANWTYEGGSQTNQLALTATFQQFSVNNILIDTASMANVGVFIWVDDDNAAANDTLYLTAVQLEKGNLATPFAPKQIATETLECVRWYCQAGGNSQVFPRFDTVESGVPAARIFGYSVGFSTPMRAAPTVTVEGSWQMNGFSGTQPTIIRDATGYHFSGSTDGVTGQLRIAPNSADDLIRFDAGL